jgi:hypothetical protein
MPADTAALPELAPESGLRGGHPALDRETAMVLGEALIEHANREVP